MNLPKLGISRPVTVLMIVLMVLIVGYISFIGTPLDLFPDMEIPVLLVTTSYSDAGPEEVENMVTRPLEQSLSALDGLDTMSSTSRAGQSQVVLMFDWDTDMDFAALDARETIDMVRGQLPDGADDPMTMQIDPDMLPIIQIGMSGDLNQEEMTDLAEDQVQSRLERIDGVAAANVTGGIEREIEIAADPYKMSAYGVSQGEISDVLAASNIDTSGGTLTDGGKEYLVEIRGEFDEVAEIGRMIVGQTSSGPVRIEDFAEIYEIREEQEPLTRLNGEPTISLSIQSASGANIVEVARQVHGQLDAMEAELPGNIHFDIAMDQSEYIEESIENIMIMGLSGAIIAMFVLWLFLGSALSTIIIAIAMPLSVVGTFILIYFQGFTLNIITIGGLALGIGMMVDNAIVILENIFRKREEGIPPIESAISGSNEVTGAIIAATLTSVAAFIPIVFAEGIAEIIFAPMAWTVAFALISSLLAAIGLIPLMTVKFLPFGSAMKQKTGKIPIFMSKLLGTLTSYYERVIDWSLGKRGWLVAFVLLLLVLSMGLVTIVGTDFLPPMDTGEISIELEFAPGTPIEETDEKVKEFEKLLSEIPEIKTVFSTVGSGGPMAGVMDGGDVAGNSARLGIRLVDDSDRDLQTYEVAEAIRGTLPRIPGADITVETQDMAEATGTGEAGIEVAVKGDDLDELERLSGEIAQEVDRVEGTREVETNFDDPREQYELVIDHEYIQTHGLTTYQIGSFLNTALSGSITTFYREAGEEYEINLHMAHPDGWELSHLEGLLMETPGGYQLPIEDLADIELGTAPRAIDRDNQERTGRVSAELVDRDLGSAMNEIQERVDEIDLPMGYFIEYGGEYEEMMEAFEQLALVLLLAVVLVYMVLAAQFESLTYPFVIMFTLPQTLIGVILALLFTGRTFSVVAFIGVIMLAGIVVNNGIVLVDYINLLYRERGYDRYSALKEAGKRRFRPVLMTSSTTIVGMFPLALGIGDGAEASAPMATVVIGGLFVATLLTLVFVPVMYSLMDDFGKWVARAFKGEASS